MTLYYAKTPGSVLAANAWNILPDGSFATDGTPVAGDTCYLNNKVMTLAAGERFPASGRLLSLRNSNGDGATAGGSLTLTSSTVAGTPTTVGATTITASTAFILSTTGNGAYGCTIDCSLVTGGGSSNAYGLKVSSTVGLVTVTGSVYAGSVASATGIYSDYSGPIRINGNVTGGAAHGVNLGGNNVITVDGGVTTGSVAAQNGIYLGTGLCTINNNVTGGAANNSAIRNDGAGTTIVNGMVTGGAAASAKGIYFAGAGVAQITNAIAGNALHAYAVSINTTTGYCVVSGRVENNISGNAIDGPSYFTGVQRNYVQWYNDELAMSPPTRDVRTGYVYGSQIGSLSANPFAQGF